MIDVRHNRCEECPIRASFGFFGKEIKKCYKHKLDGMINLTYDKCEECINIANYGPLFSKKKHCHKHKLSNEFKNTWPICNKEECSEKALYTDDGTNYPVRCETHKKDTDINIVEKECNKCGLTFFLNEKTGLCNDCNDFEIKKVHKAKETATIEFLKTSGVKFMSEDKIPEGGCSKYHPDAVIDYLYFILIIEIDEHQHSSYSYECEMTRMIQLQQDYGGIPIIFVRFNPDNYSIVENGIKKTIKPSSKRLNALFDLTRSFNILAQEYEKGIPLPSLSTCYLFYDNYDGNPVLKKIDIFNEVSKLNNK